MISVTSKFKKIISIIAIGGLLSYLSGCDKIYTTSVSNYNPAHIYRKDVQAIITDIDCRHWYAGAHFYTCDIVVYSEEYDISNSFHLTGLDAKEMFDYRQGDVVTVELTSRVNENTGEIVNRTISRIQK